MIMERTTAQPFASRPIYSDTYPLDEFYAARGLSLPEILVIDAKDAFFFEPSRSLLAHQSDMTSTLEKFHNDTLRIQLIDRHVHENEYYREVLLVLERAGTRAGLGATKINLGLFPAAAQQEILQEKQPLGKILTTSGVPFSSRPSAYFRVVSDEFISDALQVDKGTLLFGRRNSLFDSFERPLAEIVEILAPPAHL